MTARIYVGTYAKYNSGSIKGAWIDLDDYADREAFYKACSELHKDEADPELMFQDYEGFPRTYYSESNVPDELWAWLELSDDDQELLSVYRDEVNAEGSIDGAREAFSGKFDSKRDWAQSFLEDTGALASVPEHLQHYIDFDAYARDAEFTFVRKDGDVWVFYS